MIVLGHVQRYLADDTSNEELVEISKAGEMATKINTLISQYREKKYQQFSIALSKIRNQSVSFKSLFFSVGAVLLCVVGIVIIFVNDIINHILNLVNSSKKLAKGNLKNEILIKQRCTMPPTTVNHKTGAHHRAGLSRFHSCFVTLNICLS